MFKSRVKYFVVLLLFIFSIKPQFSLVYVHIGAELPHYIYDALEQARLFNKTCPLFLLTDAEIKEDNINRLERSDVTLIDILSLEKTPEHRAYLKKEKKKKFWKYTSERLLVLYDFMEKYNIENVFHIENDNLIYVDLETLFPIFKENYPYIAGTFDNDKRCILGFTYIANIEAIQEIVNCLIKYAEGPNMTDMLVLPMLKRKKGDTFVSHLPIITPEYQLKNKLITPRGRKVKNEMLYINNIEKFNSIFDGAALGQYLGGIDPIHVNSKPGFINESCIFDPSLCQFEWRIDEKERLYPILTYENKSYRINNLHIHSKNLQKFSSIKKDTTLLELSNKAVS